MPHGFIDAGLAIVVLLAGGFIGLGGWLIRRYITKQDGIEQKVLEHDAILEAYKLAQSGSVRIPLRVNGHAQDYEDSDGDKTADASDTDPVRSRVRSGKSSTE